MRWCIDKNIQGSRFCLARVMSSLSRHVLCVKRRTTWHRAWWQSHALSGRPLSPSTLHHPSSPFPTWLPSQKFTFIVLWLFYLYFIIKREHGSWITHSRCMSIGAGEPVAGPWGLVRLSRPWPCVEFMWCVGGCDRLVVSVSLSRLAFLEQSATCLSFLRCL